jgi:hypothetical protein
VAGCSGGGVAGNVPVGRTDYTGNLGFIAGDWRSCLTQDGGAIPLVKNTNPAPGQVLDAWGEAGTVGEYLLKMDGIFSFRGTAKISDVVDGSSNTIMLMEDHHWSAGRTKPDQYARDTGWASTMQVSTAANLINQSYGYTDPHKCHGISSTHVGGAHIALTDGAVRFISENMAIVTLQAIANRNGGIPTGDY